MPSAQKTAYIVVKRISSSLSFKPLRTYEFSLFSEKPLLEKAQGEGSIVAVKKVPKIYGKLLENPAQPGGKSIGQIQWTLSDDGASSFFYSPKTDSKEVGGLGYYLDLLSCNDLLKSFQISYICTHNPNDSRIDQMKRVGNIPGEPNDIRTYMGNNAKAVRFKAVEFRRGLLES